MWYTTCAMIRYTSCTFLVIKRFVLVVNLLPHGMLLVQPDLACDVKSQICILVGLMGIP